MSEMESWKNVTPGRFVIKKFNARNELVDEMVTPGKVFHLTPNDRRLNQEKAASPDLDFFQNGYLTPVRLIETEEDAKEIASNPNLMGESDMRDLFKGNWKVFDAKIKEISNLTTLERILEVAHEVDATVRQVETVQNRIQEVRPSDHVEISHNAPLDERTGLKPISPR